MFNFLLSESGKKCNTFTKDPATSHICRYTTLWNDRHRTQAGDDTDQLRDQRWWSLTCGPKQTRLKFGPLCCLRGPSTDGLSTSTIHDNKPAETGDPYWVGQAVAAFGWSRHWSVASPAWVRCLAARGTHWTFDVKTARCDMTVTLDNN